MIDSSAGTAHTPRMSYCKSYNFCSSYPLFHSTTVLITMQVSLLHKGCVVSRKAIPVGLVSSRRCPVGYTRRCMRHYSSQNDDILGDNEDTFALVRFIEFLETSRNWSTYERCRGYTSNGGTLSL